MSETKVVPTREQIEKWRALLEGNHVILSPVEIGRYDLVALCDLALAQLGEPGDTKVVSRDPTEEMYAAAEREWDGRMSARSAGVWKAMFDAAPASPPAGEGADRKEPR